MKRFFIKTILLFSFFFILSCGTQKKAVVETQDSIMMLLIDDTFNRYQIDSLCINDGLSVNVNEWIAMSFMDEEAREMVYEYVYIKDLNEDEIMYRIIVIDEDNFKIIKRLTNNYPL